MAAELEYELCPETGIGCMLIRNDSDTVKIDLMPDEADNLRQLVESGDLEGAKTLLSGVDQKAVAALDSVGIEKLAEQLL